MPVGLRAGFSAFQAEEMSTGSSIEFKDTSAENSYFSSLTIARESH
jgi:hypothetical protein